MLQGAGSIPYTGNDDASGAGHGGAGAVGKDGDPPGTTYGNEAEPVTLGSGGGSANNAAGGAGGGAIHFVLAGDLIVDGVITANGGAGVGGTYDGGGGSGNIVLIFSNVW